MYKAYANAEQELLREIKSEKSFWKRLGKVIALQQMMKREF